MKITCATKKHTATHKDARPVHDLISIFNSVDEGQNRYTVMFLVTTFEMILTGLN